MASRPTPAVQADAIRTAAAIKDLLSALPNESDIGAPNDRERIWHARNTLSGIVTSLTSPLEGRLVKLDRRLAERNDWHCHLADAVPYLESQLQKKEGSNFREAEELRQSLRFLRDGGNEHDVMFAGGPLAQFLRSRGVQPEPGARSFLAGRGGLLSTEREIAELNKERDEIIAQIESSLEYAKQFIGSMAAPATVAT